MVTNLTTNQIQSIQIDEGLIVLNFGETGQEVLAPTRGGGEFSATATIRDIEFDGRHGKTAGMQVIEEQAASLKVTALSMTQERLASMIPNATVDTTTGKNNVIKNPGTGYISVSGNYVGNVTMFCKTIGGKYKKIQLFNVMHEGGLNVKAVQKAEGEMKLEFMAHYEHTDLDGELWQIEELNAMPTITGYNDT